MDDASVRERVARVEGLLGRLDGLGDPGAREQATEALAAVVELYGEGLRRIVGAVGARDGRGELAAALAADELVSHLLVLHDLHPVAVEVRVREAIERAGPVAEGSVELVSVDGGVARLRITGGCHSCPSSRTTLSSELEQAILAAAPELEQIVSEAAPVALPPPAPGELDERPRVPLPQVRLASPTSRVGAR